MTKDPQITGNALPAQDAAAQGRLQALREKIAGIDAELQAVLKQRLDLVRLIGLEKEQAALPLVDPLVEKQTVRRYEDFAAAQGISRSAARKLAKAVIGWSRLVQARHRS